MATKGERQALFFLGAVALLGAGTRLYRARHVPLPNGDLDRQITAVQTVATRGRGRGSSAQSTGRRIKRPLAKVDIDLATAVAIEQLPGVGPAIAKRIVDDRGANGTFGCLAALGTVKGIRPAILHKVDSLATFSGAPRASCP